METKRKSKLTIVADANMPHLDFLFSEFAEITKLNGRAISAIDVADADALLCRSITQVNQQLLEASKVQFVGTATIGTDHLQIDWLNANGIRWVNAAGCNAAAVGQYILSGIAYWLKKTGRNLSEICVGIVGAGNVGSQLAFYLEQLNVSYRLCDPPLKNQGDPRDFISFDEILDCDVVTLHVPLTQSGENSTWHLVDDTVLAKLGPNQLLINASRGEVVDNVELLAYLQRPQHAETILDVFENEPNISLELARQCLLATPHIAGHSLEGKSRGSFMVYQALCDYFSIETQINVDQLFPPLNRLSTTDVINNDLTALLTIYDIEKDSQRLLQGKQDSIATHFDSLRKNYQNFFPSFPRRDYSGWSASCNFPKAIQRILKPER